MKRTLLLSGLLAISTLTSVAQDPLPNPGFEDWTQFNGGLGSTYREPDGWNSANQCSQILANYAVSRSTDAHSGTYSVELKTKSAFGNIRINGLMSTSTVICGTNSGGIEGGIESSLIPDSIAFWYKYAPVDQDTAYVQVILLNGNDTVSYLRGKIHVAASSWTRASFAIPAPTATPTLISVLLNSSWGDGSQGEAVVNSTFHVDDLEFILPNSIGEMADTQEAEVYPNPVRDFINIRNPKGEPAMVEILDATGRSVVSRPLNGTQARMDVSFLREGVYLYQIRGLNGHVIRTGKLLRAN